MQIKVTHTINKLADDYATIPVEAAVKSVGIVRSNVEQGNQIAQGFARDSAGPHGKNYWKRITSESTGTLTGEYGPHGDVRRKAIGAGWRNGPPNTDLARSADVIGPKFAADVRDMLGELPW